MKKLIQWLFGPKTININVTGRVELILPPETLKQLKIQHVEEVIKKVSVSEPVEWSPTIGKVYEPEVSFGEETK